MDNFFEALKRANQVAETAVNEVHTILHTDGFQLSGRARAVFMELDKLTRWGRLIEKLEAIDLSLN